MSTAHAVATTVWSALQSSLVHGTVLAVITLVLSRTLLRNARPALLSALWTIVLVKFLVPVGPEVPISLSGGIDSLFGASADAAARDASLTAASVQGVAGADASAARASVWPGIALFGAYALLVAVIAFIRLRHERRYQRWAASLPLATEPVQHVARRAAAIIGLARAPVLRVSAGVTAPQIVGIGRPIVVVPERIPDISSGPAAERTAAPGDERAERMLEAMLLHEFAHLRRRDTWLRVLQSIVATLYFFWPVVRWVNRRIDEQREMACDQWVMARGRIAPTEYARTLLTLARHGMSARPAAPAWLGRAPLGHMVLGLALWHGQKQLALRIHALMRGHARPRVGIISGLALVCFAMVSLGQPEPASRDVAVADLDCEVESSLLQYILHAYPEADLDGDGVLSPDEVCAQKRRLAELGAFDPPASPALAEAVSYDPVLATLDADWLECKSCGCEPGSGQDPDNQFSDMKVCTTN